MIPMDQMIRIIESKIAYAFSWVVSGGLVATAAVKKQPASNFIVDSWQDVGAIVGIIWILVQMYMSITKFIENRRKKNDKNKPSNPQ